jgi:hypothetical protein
MSWLDEVASHQKKKDTDVVAEHDDEVTERVAMDYLLPY